MQFLSSNNLGLGTVVVFSDPFQTCIDKHADGDGGGGGNAELPDGYDDDDNNDDEDDDIEDDDIDDDDIDDDNIDDDDI